METKCCAVKPFVWSVKLSYVLIVAKFAIMLKRNMKPLIRNDKTNTHRIFMIKRRGAFFLNSALYTRHLFGARRLFI